MKSKERPWALTKEGPTREVKNDHESPKAQKEGKKIYKKGKKKKRRGPKLRPRSKAFERKPENPEKDANSLEDPLLHLIQFLLQVQLKIEIFDMIICITGI